MTNEERDIISQFVARVGGQAPPSGGFGSVPATVPAQTLPPVDPEADRFIADQFARYPEARYRITQAAFVQEAALAEAQNRIKRLEWELDQTRRQAAQPQQQPQQQQSKGLFGSLFGGGAQRSSSSPSTSSPSTSSRSPSSRNTRRPRAMARRPRRNIRRATSPACSSGAAAASSARRSRPRPGWPAASWSAMR